MCSMYGLVLIRHAGLCHIIRDYRGLEKLQVFLIG